MSALPSISVTVVYSAQHEQAVIELSLREGATIAAAIADSGLCERFPEIDPVTVKAGVWGKVRNLQHALREDRKSTRLNSSHIQKSRMPSSA